MITDDERRSSDDEGHSESTEDRPTPKRPKGNKGKTKGPTFSTTSQPSVMSSKLGPKRKFLKPASISRNSPPLSVASTASAPMGSTASDSSSIAWIVQMLGLLCLNDLPTTDKGITREAKVQFRLWLATEDMFPDNTKATQKAQSIYKELCEETAAVDELKKFKTDQEFSRGIIALVSLTILFSSMIIKLWELAAAMSSSASSRC
ncbi:hypothetical protein FRC02_004474 [Tulasnella sp. 418]|nr:hypothetical protein FRC02_004474 [Tulasnella sp. 418]